MIKRTTISLDENFIKKIVEKYGSPIYIFDEKSFIDNFYNLKNTFCKYYPKYEIAYSYKTNYTPYICKLVKRLGGYAEVVSDFEYYIAKKIAYNSSGIIYNGPYKKELFLEHIRNNGINNIDNEQEALRIIEFARKHRDVNIKLGIRVNIDIGQNFISRFGLDPKSDEFIRVIDLVNATSNCEIVGIHCHVGQSRGLASWVSRVDRVIEIIKKYFSNSKLEYIDLGSGMFGDMEEELSNQFSNVPTYEEYAKVISSRLLAYYRGYTVADLPILFTEPGATAISRYFFLVTKVMSKKTVRGRKIAGLDSSFFNAGETCRYKNLPVKVFSNGSIEKAIDLVGYTCLEEDVIYANYCGSIDVGDIVVFGNVGGYSTVFKPPFIMPDCAILVWKNNDVVELIKQQQTYDDVLKNYLM